MVEDLDGTHHTYLPHITLSWPKVFSKVIEITRLQEMLVALFRTVSDSDNFKPEDIGLALSAFQRLARFIPSFN